MILKEFFVKDINRTIETVIKADDQEHISGRSGGICCNQ